MGGVEVLVGTIDHAEASGAVEVTEWPGMLQVMVLTSCRPRCSEVREELSVARSAEVMLQRAGSPDDGAGLAAGVGTECVSDAGLREVIVSLTAVRLATAAMLSNTLGLRWSEELVIFSEVSGKDDRYKKGVRMYY